MPFFTSLSILSTGLEDMDCGQLHLCLSLQTAATILVEYEGELMRPTEKGRRVAGGFEQGSVSVGAVSGSYHWCIEGQCLSTPSFTGLETAHTKAYTGKLHVLGLFTDLHMPLAASAFYTKRFHAWQQTWLFTLHHLV
jgi:hypothetical protein